MKKVMILCSGLLGTHQFDLPSFKIPNLKDLVPNLKDIEDFIEEPLKHLDIEKIISMPLEKLQTKTQPKPR